MAPYCVSKASVEAFSDSLRQEMEPWGVRVSVMEPGAFQTLILDPERIMKQIQGLWESIGKDMQQAYGERFFKSSKAIFWCEYNMVTLSYLSHKIQKVRGGGATNLKMVGN